MRGRAPGAPAREQAAQQAAAGERPAGRAVAGQAAAKLARDTRCLIQKFGLFRFNAAVLTAPACTSRSHGPLARAR
jgi:hypothetical protein